MSSKHESHQHRTEQKCLDAYLASLDPEKEAGYSYERAEAVFGAQGQWEFVLRSPRHAEWVGIEVKSLVIPSWQRQCAGWDRFCRLLTRELQRRPDSDSLGEFAIITGAVFNFNQTQSRQLRRVMADLICSARANLLLNQVLRLESDIAGRFPEWPSTPSIHDLRLLQTPLEVSIMKLGDKGCTVEPGIIGTEALLLEPAVAAALSRVFASLADNGCKANHQLMLAKRKGAHKGILLLDLEDGPWNPELVAAEITTINRTAFADIDEVFLVKAGDNLVSRVWP